MFGCIPENAPTNILQYLAKHKKKKKKKKPSHPNTTEIDQKPTTTTAIHPTNPPRATTNQTPTEIDQKPTHNPPRPTVQNQESSSKSIKPHQLRPTGNTIIQNRQQSKPNGKSSKLKKKKKPSRARAPCLATPCRVL